MVSLPIRPRCRRFVVGAPLAVTVAVALGALALSSFSSGAAHAQMQVVAGAQPDGFSGGKFVADVADEITPEQRRAIETQITANVARLKADRRFLEPRGPVAVLFDWPLRLAAGLSEYGYHGISNFVDHEPAFPNQLLDWNCGIRTYDLASGYNHSGTDIFLWPFAWLKVDNDQVEIVAAASGTIVLKQDGYFDRNCNFNSNPFNGIFVQHADGTVGWYIHMKSGSLTTKNIGDTVISGEYLGIVGSSGSSTGPHLHFEVRDMGNALLDPYQGLCNTLNGNSLWFAQRRYYDSAINRVTTNPAPPVFPTCPNQETPNEGDYFNPGNRIYFTSYYRDQLATQTAWHTIYRPDGSVYSSWTFNLPVPFYASAYWYWWFTPSGPTGRWRYEIVYESQAYEHQFFLVNGPTPTRTATPLHTPTPTLTVSVTPTATPTPCAGGGLTVGVADGVATQPGFCVDVELDNPDTGVGAVQGNLVDVPDEFELSGEPGGVTCTGRSAGFHCSANQMPDNRIAFVVVDFGGRCIDAGSGPILRVCLRDKDLMCPAGSNVELQTTDVKVANCAGQGVAVCTESGRIECGVLGDCNPPHDGVIDIFDVLYKIDIILGREVPPAGPRERILCDDDCNGDIDIFDVLREIDAILGRIPQPLTCPGSFTAAPIFATAAPTSVEKAPSAAAAEGTRRSSPTKARVSLRQRGRAVMLANRTAVRGIELTLTPEGGPVRVVGIQETARSHGFVVDYHQTSPTAPVKVVLVSLAGETLQPGRGAIVAFDLGPARHRGRLRLTDVRVVE